MNKNKISLKSCNKMSSSEGLALSSSEGGFSHAIPITRMNSKQKEILEFSNS